ncbi:unnamed protein product [Rhizoctonia solani]|uniref:Small ribosomal subunit protein eS31 domain-containing protein n=1 Tax=Rhizoctonia solani TaxID=456999 RepID=A0A8H3DJC6_9AGAM|nr:unnamed protein product [Rhizoctonia solani]
MGSLLGPEQVIFIGVTDPCDPRVETADEVRDRLLEAARHLPADRLGATDDCGFAPFGDNTSISRETAFAKIAARIQGAKMATLPAPQAPNAAPRAGPSRPKRTLGKTVDAYEYPLPRSVRKILENGWNVHIPWTHTTDEYCQSHTHSSKLDNTVKISGDGQIVISDTIALSADGEDSLRFDQWFSGYKRVLPALLEYPSLTEEQPLWEAHFNRIVSKPQLTKFWPVYRAYDIRIRTLALTTDIDPSIEHKDLPTLPQAHQACLNGSDPHPQVGPPADPHILPLRTIHPNFQRPKLPNIKPTRPFGVFYVENAAMVAPNLASAKAHSTSCSRTANGYSHRDSECATSTTGLKVAHVPVAPLDSTIARCVETTHTRPSLAENDPRKIVTPLVPDTWESMLKTYDLWDDYEDVPTGLRYGFRIGVSSILNDTRIPKNHKSATDRPTVITRHINKEVSAGRYSGPFSLNTLTEIFGHFHAAPLGIIEKASSPGEFRVIQDFSFPRDTSYHSLNSQINPDNFPCDWGFFSNVAKIIATIDPASEAATFDVEAAYRQMPVHIDDQPRMVVIWNGFAWVDHCVPFGAASSNGIFARCGDAKRRVLELKFHTFVLKWVDDFLIFRIPSSKSPLKFTFGIDEILEFAIPLGWPWKESKTRPFASLFIYIGFEWNIRDRIVCIPLPKCQKYTRKIAEWIQSPKVTLRFTQTILGTLTHCALAVPEGRSRLSGISRFAATFSTAHQDRFKARTPSSWAKADAECEPALCAYAASFAGSYAGGTAASSIAALKAHHHRHNLPWAGSQRLSCVLKGVSRLAPPQLSDSKRPPVTLEMLSALHSDLKLSTSFDTAIFAIALVAFWSQCRLGELLGSSRLRHNPRTQPCRKDLIKAPSSLPDGLWKLNLPRTKTSFHSGEQVLIAHQTDPFDPTKALDALFQLNPNFPPSAHLFAYSCPKLGGPRNITREEFLDKCNSIWEKRGFPRFTGHSFRIGGTTELLASGTAPDIVKTTGRWTSNSYLKYWRANDFNDHQPTPGWVHAWVPPFIMAVSPAPGALASSCRHHGARGRVLKFTNTPKKIKHKRKKAEMAILKYYKVDLDGKIKRLRECLNAEPGTSVFMAFQPDCQYCSKCHLTYTFVPGTKLPAA